MGEEDAEEDENSHLSPEAVDVDEDVAAQQVMSPPKRKRKLPPSMHKSFRETCPNLPQK